MISAENVDLKLQSGQCEPRIKMSFHCEVMQILKIVLKLPRHANASMARLLYSKDGLVRQEL